MIDFNKPVKTRDGRKVRILCTDMNNDQFRVAALVKEYSGEETAQMYGIDGSYYPGSIDWSFWDLVNVQEETVKYYIVEKDMSIGINYDDVCANKHHCAGVLKLTYVDGKLTNAEVV